MVLCYLSLITYNLSLITSYLLIKVKPSNKSLNSRCFSRSLHDYVSLKSLNVRYFIVLLLSLVLFVVFPLVFLTSFCITSNVYHQQALGKNLLLSDLVFPGFIIFSAKGLRRHAPHASHLQRYGKGSSFAAFL